MIRGHHPAGACRGAGHWGLIGCLVLVAAASGCRSKANPTTERSRSVPPEWIGMDAGAGGASVPGLPSRDAAIVLRLDAALGDAADADVSPPELPPPPPSLLAVGDGQACWVRPDRRVVCWGANDRGQVTGRAGPLDGPRLVRGVTEAVEVRAGRGCSCARTESGAAFCWGSCENLPEGARPPEPVDRAELSWTRRRALADCTLDVGGSVSCVLDAPGDAATVPLAGVDEPAVELAASMELACVRLESGAVKCWTARDAELAEGGARRVYRARDVPGIADAVQLAAGANDVCIRLTDGKVVCAVLGRPGVDDAGAANGPSGVPILGLPVAVEDAAALVWGVAFCALRREGGAACWSAPEIGDDGSYPSRIPVRAVAGLTGATSLAAGEIGCAIEGTGRVVCWDLSGLIDASARLLRARPAAGLDGAVQLAVRADVACARDAQGTVRCRRAGDEQAEPVPDVTGALDLAAVPDGFCTLSGGGWLWCWPAETPVIASTMFVALAADEPDRLEALGADVCVPRPEGGHRCWSRTAGLERHEPVERVDGLAGTLQLALAQGIACGLVRGGEGSCWGRHPSGSTTARAMPQLGRSASIVTWAGTGLCALRGGGEVTCQDFAVEGAPSQPVGGLEDGVQAMAGGPLDRACAVLRDGGVRCWRRSSGDAALVAEPVEGPADVVDVAVGEAHACALARSGEVSCWGEHNRHGETGRPPSDAPAPPARVEGLVGVRAIAAGPTGSCALVGSSEVWCWGSAADPANGWQPRKVEGLLEALEDPVAAPGEPIDLAADPDAGPEPGAADGTD